ncbi:protein CDV3 homolog [Neodiprion pinetum]|uniref:Protein CDV3 homolog n=1 Tax=Neodiprion lecontei TaxID=441921 RepID=A0A6J0BY73_NEOLC|nr:protein CDV3 homolog [Neodiprion lecontei]XP_046415850.1 protein CDV3 homolog [Neodiprion fabricii]XP_046471727.1 protein CDV3 homolog [Neodiprion pinetum]XP_046609841.1 protein CDV3 homolog [Neodiprion virginianus]
MADLDDFFAKKDRKKAKGKKFTTTEEIAKKLEETGKKVEKPKPKEKPTNQEGEEIQPVEEEDEWRDFEEEKKDYTGLKIGNLTVNEAQEAETDDERGEGENNSDGESGEAGPRHSGPWKRPEQPPPQPEPEPAPVVPQPAVGGSSYKAPHLRNAQSMSASPRQRMRNTAPDIHSEEYFPTLSAAQQQNSEPTGPWGRRRRDEGSFEEVRNRGGTRSYSVQETQAQAPKLSLGNKYGALSQDQS